MPALFDKKGWVQLLASNYVAGHVTLPDDKIASDGAKKLRSMLETYLHKVVYKNDIVTPTEIDEIYELMIKGRVFGWLKGEMHE